MKILIVSIVIIILLLVISAFTFLKDWIKATFYISHMEGEGRLVRMDIDNIIEKLEINPGQKIADIGAGSGLFSRKIAAKNIPDGIVYSVDINQHLLDHISDINKKEGIKNIVTVLAEENDAKIPELVDLIYICDTFHYIEKQEEYVKKMSSYLKDGGRIAIVDFKQNWPPLSVKFTSEDLIKWMKNAGLKLINNYDFVGDEFLMIFKKE